MDIAINRVLKLGQYKLKKGGVRSHILEANILLAHCSDTTLENMVAHPEDLVSKNAKNKFIKLIGRRVGGEPISYLCQESYFYSRRYLVNKGVFIPRPETELLVEIAISAIKKNPSTELICLDMCTGSGCIGLTVVDEVPNIKKNFLVDNSYRALRCCKKNQKIMRLEKKTKIIFSNLFQNIPKIKFDYIFSNPPYVTKQEYEMLGVSTKKYEPKSALFSKFNGLAHIKKIALCSTRFLREKGMIFFGEEKKEQYN